MSDMVRENNFGRMLDFLQESNKELPESKIKEQDIDTEGLKVSIQKSKISQDMYGKSYVDLTEEEAEIVDREWEAKKEESKLKEQKDVLVRIVGGEDEGKSGVVPNWVKGLGYQDVHLEGRKKQIGYEYLNVGGRSAEEFDREVEVEESKQVNEKEDTGEICVYCKKVVDGGTCPTCGRGTILVGNPEKVTQDPFHLKSLKVKYFGEQWSESKQANEKEEKTKDDTEVPQTMKAQEKPNIDAEDFRMEDYSEEDLEKIKDEPPIEGPAMTEVPEEAMIQDPEKLYSSKNGLYLCNDCCKTFSGKESCVHCKSENIELLVEGYDVRGRRDGTGPHKDSAQRSVHGDRGVRKMKGEVCPKSELNKKGPTEAQEEDGPVAEAKAPWEMSKEEYGESVKFKQGERTAEDKARNAFMDEYRDYLEETKPEYGGIAARNLMGRPLNRLHEELITFAVEIGKPVPRNVLEEYSYKKWAQDALAKLTSEDRPAEAKTTEAAEDVGFTKEVYQVWYKDTGTGKEDSTRVMAFDEADAKKVAKKLNREIIRVEKIKEGKVPDDKDPEQKKTDKLTEYMQQPGGGEYWLDEPQRTELKKALEFVESYRQELKKVLLDEDYEIQIWFVVPEPGANIHKITITRKSPVSYVSRENDLVQKDWDKIERIVKSVIPEAELEDDLKRSKRSSVTFVWDLESKKEAKESKLTEGVSELIGEVTGIDAKDQGILQWALDNGFIDEEWPPDEVMIDALETAEIKPEQEPSMDLRAHYLFYILLLKAKQAHRNYIKAKESKKVDEGYEVVKGQEFLYAGAPYKIVDFDPDLVTAVRTDLPEEKEVYWSRKGLELIFANPEEHGIGESKVEEQEEPIRFDLDSLEKFEDKDGATVYILPDVDFSGDIASTVEDALSAGYEEFLYGELGTDEGITNKERSRIWWGSDVQDHLSKRHSNYESKVEEKVPDGTKFKFNYSVAKGPEKVMKDLAGTDMLKSAMVGSRVTLVGPRGTPTTYAKDEDKEWKPWALGGFVEEGKVDEAEETFRTVAKGIEDKSAADEVARREKGQVVADDEDVDKFMVIVKEAKE